MNAHTHTTFNHAPDLSDPTYVAEIDNIHFSFWARGDFSVGVHFNLSGPYEQRRFLHTLDRLSFELRRTLDLPAETSPSPE